MHSLVLKSGFVQTQIWELQAEVYDFSLVFILSKLYIDFLVLCMLNNFLLWNDSPVVSTSEGFPEVLFLDLLLKSDFLLELEIFCTVLG